MIIVAYNHNRVCFKRGGDRVWISLKDLGVTQLPSMPELPIIHETNISTNWNINEMVEVFQNWLVSQ